LKRPFHFHDEVTILFYLATQPNKNKQNDPFQYGSS
jgi:hypothetical protein